MWGGTDAVEGRHPPAYQSVPLGPFPVPPAILSLPSSVAVLPRSFLAPLPPSLCAPLQRRSLGGGRGGAPAGWPQGRCRSQGGTLPQRPPRYFAPPRAVGSRTPAAADTSVAVAGHAVGGPVVGIEGVRVLSARGLPPAATRSPPTAAPSATTPLSPWWNPPTVGWLSWRLTPGRWAGWESVRGLRGRRRHRCQRSSRGRQRQVGGGGRTGDGSICSVSKAVAYPPPSTGAVSAEAAGGEATATRRPLIRLVGGRRPDEGGGGFGCPQLDLRTFWWVLRAPDWMAVPESLAEAAAVVLHR